MNDSKNDNVTDFDDAEIYEPENPERNRPPGPQILEDQAEDSWEGGEREAAFGAGPPKWNGKQLRPWTSAREAHWIEVRHSLGARHLSECVLSSYTFLPDAFRILFLCHAEQSLIEDLRGDPVRFQRAVDAWADEYVPMHRHDEAVTMAMRLYNQAHLNHAEAAPAENPTHADDLGN